jgi:hypothetical protein
MRDQLFRQALFEAQREQRREVSSALRREAIGAVSTLAEVMGDVSAPASSRVGASRTVLAMLLRDETAELVERMERLEEILEKRRI